MKRIIGSFLLILMLIPLFLACNQKPGGTDTSDDTTAAEETDRVGSLPPMSFNGDTVTILFWSDHQMKQEFDVWERDGEKVNDAVYLRNINTEAYLDVELDFIGEPGNNVNIQGFLSRAFIDAMSEQVIDIYATYTRTVGSLAAQGLCIDLLPLDHLDFDMPWWPSKLVEVSTAKEKLFFVSGDISTNMIYMMYGIFFNKELMTDFDFEMPYDLVHEGKWTLDTMIEMTRAVYNDLNGSNEKDKEDLFGMSMFNLHYDALFYGSGLRTIDKNEDDEFILSPTYTGEKMTNFLEKMCDWQHNGNNVYCNEDMAAKEIFAAGRSLFCPDRIYLATQHLASSDVLYGVLPAPLWDENQEEYCSALANPVSMYAISATSPDFDRAAAVMECMAMEAYYNTTPALFDSSFKARYSDGEEDAQMYDIIRDTIVFDPGRFYNPVLNSVADRYRSSIANNVTQWASVVSSDFNPLPSLIDQLMKKLASY